MKNGIARVKEFISGETGRKVLIIGGVILLLILLLSSFTSKKTDNSAPVAVENVDDIERKLEKRLCGLISKIDGAGEASVMITLDKTETAVYEENKRLEETLGNTSESSLKETEVVLAGSAKQPLLTGTVLPTVRGAAVVCEGASDPIVREKVANTVAKALNIGISRVYVTD